MLRKLIAGSDRRKTRLHDEEGKIVSAGRLLRNGPRAIASGLARIAAGRRPERPWISYDAQAVIDQHLGQGSAVLEFGSGMSTVWYARRAASVVSIERDEGWFAEIGSRLHALGNVDYHLATTLDAYIGAAPDASFDLIMIDGSWRLDCARFAIEHLPPGGMIYLDNADMEPGPLSGDVPAAASLLRNHAAASGLPVRSFTDFAPTQFHVQGGLMVGGKASPQ